MNKINFRITVGAIAVLFTILLVLTLIVGELHGFQRGVDSCKRSTPPADTSMPHERPAVDKYKKYQEYEDSWLETR